MGVNVLVNLGLCRWWLGHVGAMLVPGPVTFVPLVGGLVGGSQVQSKTQVAPQEEGQYHDKAQQKDNSWEGQEQVLGAKKKQHIRQLGTH